MFHFMNDDQRGQDITGPSENMVERIMAAEYNLAVQRGDTQSANQALRLMLGHFLGPGLGRILR